MKNTTTFVLKITSLLAAALLTPSAHANEITGSIGFGAFGVNLAGGTGSLSSATSFTLSDPFITTETGEYTSVPLATPITFNGFTFNPPVSSVSPLWTFTVGDINYSFDATTVSSHYNPGTRQWDIGGAGIAMVTGFSATPGVWDVNLSQSGASIVFDSTAAVSPTAHVPDGGSNALLLGGGLLGLAGIGRKWKV